MTRVEPVTETLHGVAVVDPYRWLEDQESAPTRAWLTEQNAYTDALLDKLPQRQAFRGLLEPLYRTESTSVPQKRGGRYFYSRQRADQDLPVIYVREGADGPERVLVDPHPLSPDHTVSVNLADVSTDGEVVAYSIRKGGEDETELRFLRVDTGEELAAPLPRANRMGVALTPDGKAVYHSVHSQTEGPRIYRRRLDVAGASDEVVFGVGLGPEKLAFGSVSDDGRYLVASVLHGSAGKQSEVWVQDLQRDAAPQPVAKDLKGRFSPVIGGQTLYLQTNWEAPNGRVLAVDLARPQRENWREVIPENPRAVINWVSAVAGRLLVVYLEDVKSRAVVFDANGRRQRDLSFDGIGSIGGGAGTWDSTEVFITFSSFHIPSVIYRCDLATASQSVWARIEVPVDPAAFQLDQVWFTSKDGTRVPMFLLAKKGLQKDGNRPTVLTGYGGFTASLTPSFSPSALAWAAQGGVYAVANLRGGGEFGEAWHVAGMLEKKQNVFDDFYAAAEFLIREKYTQPSRLGISGGSNGGLLVGAALTQRPELFGAVVCSYPLLDMLRYHRFLVARFWVPEYGSAEDAALFPVLRAYSPYHNVVPGTKYPAVLFVTGDGDTRVAPLHARKMAALLQSATGSGKPVLLRYHLAAGHSGGQPKSELIDNAAESLAFLAWQLGG